MAGWLCSLQSFTNLAFFPQKNLSLQSKVTRELRGNGVWQMWLLTSCNQEMLSSAFVEQTNTNSPVYLRQILALFVPLTREEHNTNGPILSDHKFQRLRYTAFRGQKKNGSITKKDCKRCDRAQNINKRGQHSQNVNKQKTNSRYNVEWWSAKEEIPRQGRLY